MDYATIQNLALSYTDRATDAELLVLVDSMFRMVEAKINRYLLVQDMVVKTQINMDINTEFYGPPLNYNAIKNVFISPVGADSKRNTLHYLAPEQMNNASNNANTVFNEYYSIVQYQLQVYPLKDNTYNLNIWYFQNVTPLDSVNTTNWCSLKNSDCYVSGMIAEMYAYAKDAEGFKLWDARFKESLASIALQDDTVSWSGTPLTIQVG